MRGKKLQLTSGGQWEDSDDGVDGLADLANPQWPAFCPVEDLKVGDKVWLYSAILDQRDIEDNHGLEWLALPMRGSAAGMIRFTLPSTLSFTDASKAGCTVDDYWGVPDPGETVTVYNPPASANFMFAGAAGAKGIAAWDDIDSKWWIIQMECGASNFILVDLDTDVTNTLKTTNGGTGLSTLTSGQLLMGNGTGAVEMVNTLSGGTF